MIGQTIPTPPPLPCSNQNSEKKPLINQITGSVINVKNTDTDLRIILMENSLFLEALSEVQFADLADTKDYQSQNNRFRFLGKAVTELHKCYSKEDKDGILVKKLSDICDKNPINQSDELNSDSTFIKRGQDFIKEFLDAESSIDVLNYAKGLRLGSAIDNPKSYEPFTLVHFHMTWYLRHKHTFPYA